jgi:hypothetical protein
LPTFEIKVDFERVLRIILVAPRGLVNVVAVNADRHSVPYAEVQADADVTRTIEGAQLLSLDVVLYCTDEKNGGRVQAGVKGLPRVGMKRKMRAY